MSSKTKTNLIRLPMALGFIMLAAGIIYAGSFCAPSAEIQKYMNIESVLPDLEGIYSNQPEMNSIVIPLQNKVIEFKETPQCKEFAAKNKLSSWLSPLISFSGVFLIFGSLIALCAVPEDNFEDDGEKS